MVEQSTDARGGTPTASAEGARWWADAVGYEVYLRSFADSDGDGIGDLRGLDRHLDHLADLGVDLVWITPFYPSPMADFGYDVADHRSVDPRFGTLEDLDRLIVHAHDLGLRVMIDIVPNHTSDAHPWFQAARHDPSSPERHRYVWSDPAPGGGPPNNWLSHFGGPAWTLDEASGEYYCHLFLPEQPDLNWDDDVVRQEFLDILEFWLDRGVDGFRIDVAHSLVKDAERRDNPVLHDVAPDASPRTVFHSMRHDHDLDQHEVLDIYRSWQRVTKPRNAVLLGEVYLGDAAAVGRYVADDDGLDLAFYFSVLHTGWEPAELRRVVRESLHHGRGRFSWVHSSHDDARAPTRFGGGDVGRARALAFLTFTAFLPGPLFLYQGDELGLENGVLPPGVAADPVAVRNADARDGRDGVRTPIPWDPDAHNLGFSTGTPWLPVGRNHSRADTVAAQRTDPDSTLHRVRELLHTRRLHRSTDAPVCWTDEGGDILSYRRGDLTVAMNAGEVAVVVRVPDDATVIFRSRGPTAVDDGVVTLGPDSTVVVSRP